MCVIFVLWKVLYKVEIGTILLGLGIMLYNAVFAFRTALRRRNLYRLLIPTGNDWNPLLSLVSKNETMFPVHNGMNII
jgi:hypothetical protein